MTVTVNGVELKLLPGMTVSHAIIAIFNTIPPNISIRDRWGNLVGLEGALADGAVIYAEIGYEAPTDIKP